jgi:undecaprenyl-diphosphatase
VIELITSPASVSWGIIIAGAIAAFAVGLAAIHFLITFVKKHTLWPFIWYRIVLAAFIIFVTIFGTSA